MAGLNDDVDDGLEPTYVEPHDENPESSPAPNIILMNKVGKSSKADSDPNAVKPSQLFGGPIIPNELPNLNAEFAIITDTANTISDNRALKDSLKQSCSICKEDAQLVNGVVPDFINEDRPINTFTDTKSKVGLKETLNALDTQFEVDVEKLRSAIETSTKTLIECFKRNNDNVDAVITQALTKYQPLLAKMIVLIDGGEGGDELATFLKLSNTVNNYELSEISEKFPEIAKDLTIITNVNFWSNAVAVVNRYPDSGSQVKYFVIDGERHTFSEKEPFLVQMGTTNPNRFTPRASLLDVIRNGLDMQSLQYFKQLNQVSHNITNAMGESLSLIGQLAAKTEVTPKEKLDTLTQIAALNNKYARHNIELLSFTQRYFDVLDLLFETMMNFGKRSSSAVVDTTKNNEAAINGEPLAVNPKVVTAVI